MVSRSCRCQDAAHAGGRYREPTLSQFVGDPDLAECWLLNGKRNCRILDETVAAVAIILQAWLTLPSCLASSSGPTLARMIFCSVYRFKELCDKGGELALQEISRSAPPRRLEDTMTTPVGRIASRRPIW